MKERESNHPVLKMDDEPIVRAIEAGDFDKALEWARRRPFGSNVLDLAADTCQFGFLWDLFRLANSRDPNIGSFFILERVIVQGRVDVVDYLFCLERIDPNHRFGNVGTTALMQACLYDQRDIVERLLAKGADPEKTNFIRQNAFFYAIKSKDLNIFRLLLLRTRRIGYVDQYGWNLLHHTCMIPNKVNDEVFDEILGLDFLDINAQTKGGSTVLHFLASWHNPTPSWEHRILALLSHPDIDLTIKDWEKKTAYDRCQSKFAEAETVRNAFCEKLGLKPS